MPAFWILGRIARPRDRAYRIMESLADSNAWSTPPTRGLSLPRSSNSFAVLRSC